MGDSKISGLTQVAAFASTQEFGVNDSGVSRKISGTQLQAAFPNGSLGYAQVVANQGSITTTVDLTGLTVTTAVLAAGRRLRITGFVPDVQSTVNTDSVTLFIFEGATQLNQMNVNIAVAQGSGLIAMVVVQPSAAAHTYKLSMARLAASGTLTMVAGVTAPAWILVEDIGT